MKLTSVTARSPGWTLADLSSATASPAEGAAAQLAAEVPPTARSVNFLFLTPPAQPAVEPSLAALTLSEQPVPDVAQLAMDFFHARGSPYQPAPPATSGTTHFLCPDQQFIHGWFSSCYSGQLSLRHQPWFEHSAMGWGKCPAALLHGTAWHQH